MLKSVLVLCLFLQISAFGQIQKFQIEAYTGGQRVHHHQCNLEDKDIHRGVTMVGGLRFHFNLNKRLAIIPGYTLNHMIGDNFKFPLERLLRLDVKYSFFFTPRFPRFCMNIETGIEWAYYDKKWKVPIFLGSQYIINSYMDLFTRIRIPSLVEFDKLSLYQLVEFTGEVGIALNPKWGYQPKFKSNGNPFILR